MKFVFGTDSLDIFLPQPLTAWADGVKESLLPLAAQLLDDTEIAGINPELSTFRLPNASVAAWPTHVSKLAGLPGNNPLPLDLRLSAGLGQPGTLINTRWLRPGTALPVSRTPEIRGLELTLGKDTFRLNEPYYTVLRLVEQFNLAAKENPHEQFRIWSHIREHLGEKAISEVTDTFLRSLRVVTADSFTLSFTTDNRGDVQLIPVLLGQPSSEALIKSPELTRSLLEIDEQLFASRLDDLPEASSAFPLSNGTYVVVDERLQKALAGIRQIRMSSPDERKRAVLHPEAVLAECLGEDLFQGQPLFIETEKYSERVQDVAEWVAPIIPWMKVRSQSWEPSSEFGFKIGGKEISLSGPELEQAIVDVESAIASGQSTVTVQDTPIPATPATLTALKQLDKAIKTREKPKDDTPEEKPMVNVLVIQTNFDNEHEYSQATLPKRPGCKSLPFSLRTVPKEHQIQGIEWLQSHWISGSTGAVLADDMGLGKTFQALAFLAWLREQMLNETIKKQPILIVAPVGLLKNWEAEHRIHLASPGLGDVVRAYGEHLKLIKRGSHRHGTASLDSTTLSQADWILANYETVSDYQLSFGAIPFAAIIFDEAQKIKSPSARMTHASKALNAEFVLAMTGTPVENRLADLWCISDTVQPLALGTLKDFSSKYETENCEEALLSLRDSIWQQETALQDAPRMMLRRMKTDKLEGLPVKHEHYLTRQMPPRQQEAYERAIHIKDVKGAQYTLEMIQALRAISLHPAAYEGGFSSEDSFNPEESARFSLLMDILDQIKAKNEKALVFVESLELQDANQLPLFLKRRYSLGRLPMVINGDVATAVRQDRVDAFQAETGFDVMLLSPKAGGVGLTLTAANHVIHLSRWWNPAVEDQCSDRAYRLGQTRDVHIYYPMAVHPTSEEHSFDFKLNSLMMRKRNLSQQLLAPSGLTKEEILELVEGL